MAPRSRPLWAAWMPAAAAAEDDAEGELLVVPVSEESDEVAVAEAEVLWLVVVELAPRNTPVPLAKPELVELPRGKKVEVLATDEDEDEFEETTPEGATRMALEAWVVTVALVDSGTEVRVLVCVSWRVEVVVPLVVSSWAAAREAPAARTVKSMLEICILKLCVV